MSGTAAAAARGQRGARARSSTRDQESDFRRLAAQLGLSRELQRVDDDDVDDDAADDNEIEASAEAPLTPLRSDYSASESHSSELSLPQSFGNYDMTRKPPFDTDIQRATKRNTARNAGVAAASQGSDMMRKFYEAQVEKIRAQLAVVTQAHRQIETTLQDERQQWTAKLAEMQAALNSERVAHKSEVDSLRSQTERLRSRLTMEKTHLNDLTISDTYAEQLARQSEADLSVKEFIQLTVHQKLRKVANEALAAQKELESLRALASGYKSDAASASDEIAQTARLAEAKEQRLQHALDLSEASRVELEAQIASLCGQLDLLRDAQSKREAEAQRRPATVDVYAENERLQSELELSNERQRVAIDKAEELRRHVDELQQQTTLLRADKSFLEDSKRQLEDHELRLLAKIKELQSKLDLMASASLNEATALHKLEDETRVKFEQQLATEIDKIMAMTKREMDTIRSSSQQVYERENRLLKEARDAAVQQIDLLQSRLASVQAALEEKVIASTRSESDHATAMASLRSELKIKHFEQSQLGLTLEERSAELRSAKLEVEMLQQKVEVHKEEFARLEAMSTTKITQLEAMLETERRRLEEYEQLEVELDDAVVQTGAIASGNGNRSVHEVASTFGSIPAASKRRFYHSVQLAQRVVKLQKEGMELQRQLDNCRSDKLALERQVEETQKQIAHVHQPQAYLIQKLSNKDNENRKLADHVDQLQKQLTALRAEYKQLHTAKLALQNQLQQVLARRGELDLLKSTVQALRTKLVASEAPAAVKSAPSPVSLKNPPSPHVMCQMTRPPSTSRSSPPSDDGDPVAEGGSSPPKWYIKLRSS